MKNLYSILGVANYASILDIAKAYQNKCMENPASCFYYTKIFKILAYVPYRLVYDYLLLSIDIRALAFLQTSLNEDEEYELAFTIHTLEYFKDFVYDSKYFFQYPKYLKLLDDWYNDLVNILDYLKNNIQSFYLS